MRQVNKVRREIAVREAHLSSDARRAGIRSMINPEDRTRCGTRDRYASSMSCALDCRHRTVVEVDHVDDAGLTASTMLRASTFIDGFAVDINLPAWAAAAAISAWTLPVAISTRPMSGRSMSLR